MSNLLEIPDDVMRIILEKSDYFGIQSLRKTCHHLRNFIDDVLPSPNTVSLGINVAEKSINLEIESRNSKNLVYWKYQDPEFSESFFRDFQIFLEFFKSQKLPLEIFSINFSTRNSSKFLENFGKTGFLKTTKISLRVFNEIETFGILKMMDSNFLENIEIENSTWENYILQTEEIRNSEQWKNAKIAEIYRFDIWSPSIFSNFEKSKGYCIDLAPEDVALLKEVSSFRILEFF
ncbi:hypothetical protein L5515_009647 [Caenorhabditis briggsae]|uniref:F-box domain-containing protein n=1 Tax=Caenorhabditis briggsae TaxID=6238 RepID=A0AAE9JP71_CAEBR|nr:hypothetical protein L5515_009647 [Caenorhabditis briggsae]